ncbi:hypothetical protein [Cellvibrio fontiphilus]|uniref:Uncharacterized protein n=1 Tax=Cellvibrio fontiphilus TaxID=1815559 RepID=A0ABV7FKC4_9GAMM
MKSIRQQTSVVAREREQVANIMTSSRKTRPRLLCDLLPKLLGCSCLSIESDAPFSAKKTPEKAMKTNAKKNGSEGAAIFYNHFQIYSPISADRPHKPEQ